MVAIRISHWRCLAFFFSPFPRFCFTCRVLVINPRFADRHPKTPVLTSANHCCLSFCSVVKVPSVANKSARQKALTAMLSATSAAKPLTAPVMFAAFHQSTQCPKRTWQGGAGLSVQPSTLCCIDFCPGRCVLIIMAAIIQCFFVSAKLQSQDAQCSPTIWCRIQHRRPHPTSSVTAATQSHRLSTPTSPVAGPST